MGKKKKPAKKKKVTKKVSKKKAFKKKATTRKVLAKAKKRVSKKPSKKKKVSKKVTKKKIGRPSIKDTINYEGLKLCYLRGFTDEEVALALQITKRTLHNWKKADPEFFHSIKDWKNAADDEMEHSLRERGVGYSHAEVKAQWCPGHYVTKGKKSKWIPGRWVEWHGTKHYPPDPTSMIYWLNNRRPKDWRAKVDHQLSGKISADLTIVDYTNIVIYKKPEGDKNA